MSPVDAGAPGGLNLSTPIDFRLIVVWRRVFHAMAAPFKDAMKPEVAMPPACGKPASNAAT